MGEFSKALMKGDKLLAHHSNEYDDYGASLTFTSSRTTGHAAAQKQLSAILCHYPKHMSTNPEKEETIFLFLFFFLAALGLRCCAGFL